MNAYSKDLRLRVLRAVERGIPRKEIADLFGISRPTIGRYTKLKASGRQIAPKPSPGRKTKILESYDLKKALWEQLEENNTATLQEHCEMFADSQGVTVSVATMSRTVRKLGWSFKKDHWEPPKETSKKEVLSGST